MQESNRTEFKAQLTDKLEKEIVAFLNYHEGGDIYIGIDDAGKTVGVDDVDTAQLIIADRIKNNILPATLGLFDIVCEKQNGKSIIRTSAKLLGKPSFSPSCHCFNPLRFLKNRILSPIAILCSAL